jgi:RNA polymerase sigma-70 factor, ECF subfamily
MSDGFGQHVTRMLRAVADGDDSATEKLFPTVYDELRILAARQFRSERAGHTLQPTAPVNQAYLGVSQRTVEAEWTMVRTWLRKEPTGDGG